MVSTKRDPLGTAVGAVLGGLVGMALAYPAVPQETTLLLGGLELGPAETFLLIGALLVVSLPVLFVFVMAVVRS